MSCYISSNQNRFYVAKEAEFGGAAAVTEASRIPAIKLAIQHQTEQRERRDKTGGRTFVGLPAGLRKRTSFDLETYMTGWADPMAEPGYGPLVEGALGAAPIFFAGGTVGASANASEVTFTDPHGLVENQAIVVNGEIRFVAAIADGLTVILNAPLTTLALVGAPVGPTVTYLPAAELPSVSIHDYWDPQSAVQRILSGCGIDEMRIRLNGDFHSFRFRGVARELLDNMTFAEGQAGLTEFPAEPTLLGANYSLVPGNLGQAWFGGGPSQFFSVLDAEIVLDNDLDTRSREFGSDLPGCLAPGRRNVSMNFSLFSKDSPETTELYQAARQNSPLPMMLQLGQEQSHLCGVYMKSVIPSVPEFDDSESRLQWKFSNSRAQGTVDDELAVAFG